MRESKFFLTISVVIVVILFLSGCAATRYVPQDKYLLRKNTIRVIPEKIVPPSSLEAYIRQKPNTSIMFGWKAFLNIYSLSPDKDNGWSRFLRRLGEAPVIFDPRLIEFSKMNMDNYLTSLGYYFNHITDSIEYKNRKATVYYTVIPGKTYSIDTIRLEQADPDLASLYDSTKDRSLVTPGSRLASSVLEKEAARISSVMRNNGYYNFNRSNVSFLADTLNKDGTATLGVQLPGDGSQRPYRIREINVYPSFDPIQAVMDTLYYKSMDSLNYEGMTFRYTEKSILRPRVIRNLSFIRPGELYDESKVKTTYERFSNIRLLNSVTLLFDEVPESLQKDTAEVDCTIRLSPGNSQGYKLNLEASSNSNGLIGISPALSYYHKNIFRGGEWLTLGFMGNFQFKINDPTRATELGASLSLSFPKMLFPVNEKIFRNRIPRTDISASYSYQSRPEYTRNIASSTFGYTWSMSDKFHYTINPFKLKLVKLYNMSPGFLQSLKDPFLIDTYRDHLDLGLSSIFYYTSDNSPVHKKTWYYVRVGLEAAGNLLSAFNSMMKTDTTGSHTIAGISYSQYIKVDLNTGYTFIRDRQQLAGRFYAGAGVAYGNASSLPLEQMFYAGGANSLRAWQARTVGPGSMPIDSTFSIPNQAGDIRLELNLEYRFPIFWKLEGALFADAGNIWTLRGEGASDAGVFRFGDFYKSIAMDAGLGLRVNLDFVILRLDLGMIVRNPVKQEWIRLSRWLRRDNYSFQFGVGYPF
ncbi:MAG TPA: BamA/TamA family outer membrane protein [Bacteroidales bacterium]|nr:BamA/TamA family outer membrane protein [Bacteroidales bacterium]HQB56007.1 BamA/TamA family outer membrane protein [Bacteroidales bacterium]